MKVSVVIPTYNEERYIEGCLRSLLASDTEDFSTEFLVIDGMSNDGTRTIVKQLSEEFPTIRLIDNEARNKPAALNLGIEHALGDILIRVDAHAIYDRAYVSRTVYHIQNNDADNVGGIRRTLPSGNSKLAKGLAYAVSNPFAAGNAVYRTLPAEDGAETIVREVDTVFGGGFPKDLFSRIGGFNLQLLRGQDREFNHRIRANGGKILLCTDIICDYYARSELSAYVRWIYDGGATPFYISRLTGDQIYSVRNLVPLAFLGSLVASTAIGFFSSIGWLLLGLITVFYLIGAFVFSWRVVKAERNFAYFFIMPVIFLLTHIPYALGSLSGLLRPVRKDAKWVRS
ncbi:MAG: glycosyltransferase family 2 protein [Parasphingorhabdus sp.]|uniref:glycosyltransferase family 2 protein n=1 Tax=Parasphingorhabdus sp. TaxID=2709688 RepID=UPI00329692ED